VAQQRCPGDLAGVLDRLLRRVRAPRDGALKRHGVLGVEGGDLLFARALGHGGFPSDW
jgi:hypothetical protein